MGSGPSVPVPDPNSINANQFGYNLLGAQAQQTMNSMNQATPYGGLNYNIVGYDANGNPIRQATSYLSPQEQYLLNTQQAGQGLAGTQAAELLGGVNYGQSPNLGGMTSGLAGQMMGAEFGAMSPYFNQQTEALQSQLANQGLTPTDPAYQTAMNNMLQSQNQSMSGFAAQAFPQAFQMSEQAYQLPLSTAASLMQMGQPANLSQNLLNTPQTNIGSVNAAGAAGVANQAAIANAQLQQAQFSGMLNGIGSLGSALIGGMF